MLLAATGNMLTSMAVFVLTLTPVSMTWVDLTDALAPFLLPAYAPALLIFTAILTVLEGRGESAAVDEEDRSRGNRIIANAVRFGLMIVLSFAVLVVLIEPHVLAHVLFAVLLSFVAIVRAELVAPPRMLDPEARFRRAAEAKRNGELWAGEALTAGWRSLAKARTWPTVALFLTAPVVIPAIAMVLIGTLVWGPGVGVAPGFIAISLSSFFGPAVQVLAWMSSADKADSARARGWRRAFLTVMSAASSLTLTVVFCFSGKNTIWMGVVLLVTAVVTEAALRIPVRNRLGRARLAVEARWTLRHMERLEWVYRSASDEWRRSRTRPSVGVRVLTALFTPFVHAARLARKVN
ncbi:hypothetical protein ACFWHT_00970 [Microbacterium sp. NPDC058342]|uniref:hypothetical protein n=1 Tax=Microbacterium sp. NPDC058342 TaxID=3346454 RepID=UPI003669769E